MKSAISTNDYTKNCLMEVVSILMDARFQPHFMYRTNGPIIRLYKTCTPTDMRWHHTLFRKCTIVNYFFADKSTIESQKHRHSVGDRLLSEGAWAREIVGQREMLAAYGGVKLSDIRGMRAPYLAVGGNRMYKMLYDSNFTYDSSMTAYKSGPPIWPYTLDYRFSHTCLIPPCPRKSYPGLSLCI